MKKLTKVLIGKINRALKVASYDIKFEAKHEGGWNKEWILMTMNRFDITQKASEQRGYEKRIEEEKAVSVFNLMEKEE